MNRKKISDELHKTFQLETLSFVKFIKLNINTITSNIHPHEESFQTRLSLQLENIHATIKLIQNNIRSDYRTVNLLIHIVDNLKTLIESLKLLPYDALVDKKLISSVFNLSQIMITALAEIGHHTDNRDKLLPFDSIRIISEFVEQAINISQNSAVEPVKGKGLIFQNFVEAYFFNRVKAIIHGKIKFNENRDKSHNQDFLFLELKDALSIMAASNLIPEDILNSYFHKIIHPCIALIPLSKQVTRTMIQNLSEMLFSKTHKEYLPLLLNKNISDLKELHITDKDSAVVFKLVSHLSLMLKSAVNQLENFGNLNNKLLNFHNVSFKQLIIYGINKVIDDLFQNGFSCNKINKIFNVILCINLELGIFDEEIQVRCEDLIRFTTNKNEIFLSALNGSKYQSDCRNPNSIAFFLNADWSVLFDVLIKTKVAQPLYQPESNAILSCLENSYFVGENILDSTIKFESHNHTSFKFTTLNTQYNLDHFVAVSFDFSPENDHVQQINFIGFMINLMIEICVQPVDLIPDLHTQFLSSTIEKISTIVLPYYDGLSNDHPAHELINNQIIMPLNKLITKFHGFPMEKRVEYVKKINDAYCTVRNFKFKKMTPSTDIDTLYNYLNLVGREFLTIIIQDSSDQYICVAKTTLDIKNSLHESIANLIDCLISRYVSSIDYSGSESAELAIALRKACLIAEEYFKDDTKIQWDYVLEQVNKTSMMKSTNNNTDSPPTGSYINTSVSEIILSFSISFEELTQQLKRESTHKGRISLIYTIHNLVQNEIFPYLKSISIEELAKEIIFGISFLDNSTEILEITSKMNSKKYLTVSNTSALLQEVNNFISKVQSFPKIDSASVNAPLVESTKQEDPTLVETSINTPDSALIVSSPTPNVDTHLEELKSFMSSMTETAQNTSFDYEQPLYVLGQILDNVKEQGKIKFKSIEFSDIIAQILSALIKKENEISTVKKFSIEDKNHVLSLCDTMLKMSIFSVNPQSVLLNTFKFKNYKFICDYLNQNQFTPNEFYGSCFKSSLYNSTRYKSIYLNFIVHWAQSLRVNLYYLTNSQSDSEINPALLVNLAQIHDQLSQMKETFSEFPADELNSLKLLFSNIDLIIYSLKLDVKIVSNILQKFEDLQGQLFGKKPTDVYIDKMNATFSDTSAFSKSLKTLHSFADIYIQKIKTDACAKGTLQTNIQDLVSQMDILFLNILKQLGNQIFLDPNIQHNHNALIHSMLRKIIFAGADHSALIPIFKYFLIHYERLMLKSRQFKSIEHNAKSTHPSSNILFLSLEYPRINFESASFKLDIFSKNQSKYANLILEFIAKHPSIDYINPHVFNILNSNAQGKQLCTFYNYSPLNSRDIIFSMSFNLNEISSDVIEFITAYLAILEIQLYENYTSDNFQKKYIEMSIDMLVSRLLPILETYVQSYQGSDRIPKEKLIHIVNLMKLIIGFSSNITFTNRDSLFKKCDESFTAITLDDFKTIHSKFETNTPIDLPKLLNATQDLHTLFLKKFSHESAMTNYLLCNSSSPEVKISVKELIKNTSMKIQLSEAFKQGMYEHEGIFYLINTIYAEFMVIVSQVFENDKKVDTELKAHLKPLQEGLLKAQKIQSGDKNNIRNFQSLAPKETLFSKTTEDLTSSLKPPTPNTKISLPEPVGKLSVLLEEFVVYLKQNKTIDQSKLTQLHSKLNVVWGKHSSTISSLLGKLDDNNLRHFRDQLHQLNLQAQDLAKFKNPDIKKSLDFVVQKIQFCSKAIDDLFMKSISDLFEEPKLALAKQKAKSKARDATKSKIQRTLKEKISKAVSIEQVSDNASIPNQDERDISLSADDKVDDVASIIESPVSLESEHTPSISSDESIGSPPLPTPSPVLFSKGTQDSRSSNTSPLKDANALQCFSPIGSTTVMSPSPEFHEQMAETLGVQAAPLDPMFSARMKAEHERLYPSDNVDSVTEEVQKALFDRAIAAFNQGYGLLGCPQSNISARRHFIESIRLLEETHIDPHEPLRLMSYHHAAKTFYVEYKERQSGNLGTIDRDNSDAMLLRKASGFMWGATFAILNILSNPNYQGISIQQLFSVAELLQVISLESINAFALHNGLVEDERIAVEIAVGSNYHLSQIAFHLNQYYLSETMLKASADLSLAVQDSVNLPRILNTLVEHRNQHQIIVDHHQAIVDYHKRITQRLNVTLGRISLLSNESVDLQANQAQASDRPKP